MIKIELLQSGSGQTHILDGTNVANFDDVLASLDDSTYYIEINSYTGSMVKSSDGLDLVVTMDDKFAVLTAGQCINILSGGQSDSDNDDPVCSNNEVVTLTPETRLAIVDEDGCHTGYTSVADIITLVVDELSNAPTPEANPQTLCEALGVNQIPSGNLSAGDNFLVINGCDIKTIPQTDVEC